FRQRAGAINEWGGRQQIHCPVIVVDGLLMLPVRFVGLSALIIRIRRGLYPDTFRQRFDGGFEIALIAQDYATDVISLRKIRIQGYGPVQVRQRWSVLS